MDALTLREDDYAHVGLDHWRTMRRYSRDEVVDAVIIGSGAGGAPIAARLAARGLKVVVLEAGPRFNPYDDFATDERSQGKLFWQHERLSAGRQPLAFGNNNSGTGVGGSTLHFTAYTPRPQPDDFALATEFGAGRDWPFTFHELLPYIEEVEEFLGVSGPPDYPWGPPRRKGYALPPLPLNVPARLMAKGCRDLGIRTAPAANAALSAPYYRDGLGWRPRCSNRGYCQVGCNSGAKASMDVTYIPLAVMAGAEVRDRSYVTGFERSRDGAITAVTYRVGNDEHKQACANVFLAAGGIETPRMLLVHGLANSSGQVGRNFMAHPGSEVWGFFDEPTHPWRGIPGGLISEDFHRAPAGEYMGGYLLQSIGVMPVTYASQLARGERLWGTRLREHMSRYSHVAGINILGDCFPSAENFVELSDELDAMGFPKPRVHFSYGENETNLAAHAEARMLEIWKAAGARDTWTFQRAAHIIGTCRMGKDPGDSVVNPAGRCHDLPNLFVSDNSVFPSALSVNPALTIMANALRVADLFLEGVSRG